MKRGARVRVIRDARTYVDGRIGTVSVCPIGIDDGEGVTVVDLDTDRGGVDPDWHLNTDDLEPLSGGADD